MRHAEASSIITDDFSRVLSNKGKEQAIEAAKFISTYCNIELILCSTSIRTVETCSYILESNTNVKVEYLEKIYSGSTADILEIIVHMIDSDLSEALVIGHNPTIFSLVTELCNKKCDRYCELIGSYMHEARIIGLEYETEYWPNRLINNGYI